MAAASNSHGSRTSTRRPPIAPGRSAIAGLLISFALAIAGCVQDDGTTGKGPVDVGGSGGEGGEGGVAGAGGDGGQGGAGCEDGDSRSCKVDLGTHGNVTSCFQGEQVCAEGAWGPCEEPKAAEQPPAPLVLNPRPGRPSASRSAVSAASGSPAAEGRDARRPAIAPALTSLAEDAPSGLEDQQWMSLSMASACGTDPCDPTCQIFDEVPGSPIGSPGEVLIAPWESGDYGGLPPALQNEGTKEPCKLGADCQFNQYCNNPTSGTCSHSKCVTGTGLNAACDPCVANVCSGSPGCCNTPIGTTGGSTCVHDLCVVGGPLKVSPTACDPCVAAICTGASAFCCTQGWTNECVNLVATKCAPKTCATGSWSQSCVDQVKTYCGAFCLEDSTAPACAHHKCYLGGPLNAACDPCVAQVCAADSYCCSGAWDGKCLQEVATICGEACPPQGDCVQWLPTETDPDCSGIDLGVGVGCTAAGGALQIPVCNHGNGTAPAGLSLVIYPPAPVVMPNAYVAYNGEPVVATPAPIPPGECIDVTLPAGTADGSQIVINPQLGPNHNNTECQNSNNWSIWSSATGSCETPSCAYANLDLEKVKLFVSVDKSASQCNPVTPNCQGVAGTRWSKVVSALTDFIQDPGSDQIAMWLRFWPLNDLVNGACPAPWPAGCGPLTGCRTPNADVANLAVAANENTLITAINNISPSGTTPMYPALDGALVAATEFKAANPDFIPVVLFVTDGEPQSSCTNSVSAIANLAANAYNGAGIRTYVIGIAEVSLLTCELIAGAGGGKAFGIADGVNTKADILAALQQIRNEAVSCSLDLPDQNIFDPTKATLVYTPGAGAPMTLNGVADLAACGGGDGWFYDNPADPSAMTLCPTTCTTVQNDSGGNLELAIDCIDQYLPSQYTQTYEAVCPPGKVPQWGFLAYDTITPGDSRVELRVHTSSDGVTYSPLPAMPTKTASAALNSQVCGLGGPAPCPVSLYSALNALPDARKKYLELVMDVYPTTDMNQTPIVLDWDVTYSCPDAE